MSDIEKKCINYYNSLYNSYINKVPYTIYITNFIDQLLHLLNINRLGFIVQYNPTVNSLYNLVFTRKQIKTSDEKLDISISPILSLNNNNCILSDVINKKTFITKNNVIYKDIFGNTFDNSEKNFTVNTFILPIIFNNDIKGLLGFITTNEIDLNIFKNILNLQYLLGTFFYSIESDNILIKDTYSRNKFLVYQIIGDILNLITDCIILLNNEYDIVYYNENVINSINVVNKQQLDIIDKNIIDIFPIFNSILSDEKNQFFKNKKINTSSIVGHINSIIIDNHIYNIIIFNKKNSTNNSIIPDDNILNKNVVACFSHELRNPLQTIINGCVILDIKLSFLKNDTPDIIDMNNIIINLNKNCKKMGIIIDDILDLHKINAKEFYINIQTCNINTFILNIIEDYNEEIIQKNLNLKYEIKNNTPEILFTDEIRLYQILSNLISNSIKYSNNGTITIIVEYNTIKHGIDFKISDQGNGIKESELYNLFKCFGQTSNSFYNKSNGVGLYLSQKIANILGGYISFKTEYKKGSIFTLFHPINLSLSNNIIIKENNTNTNTNTNIEGKILIIDNEIQNTQIFKMLLESFNCKFGWKLDIYTTNSGENAITILKSTSDYNIVFIDINMNGIDGCETTNILKQQSIYTGPIIATTGNIMAKKDNMGGNSYNKFKIFTEILIKPFTSNNLLEMLNKYI